MSPRWLDGSVPAGPTDWNRAVLVRRDVYSRLTRRVDAPEAIQGWINHESALA